VHKREDYTFDIRDMERLIGFPEWYTQFSSSTSSSFSSDRNLRSVEQKQMIFVLFFPSEGTMASG
jgi:hypothetical protein